tara:strand:- start:270 stop:1010 length:741 start_codon:yes stop_codon:yes gene_type:complete
MKKILEKLRDDKEYYGGVGRDYLSNSDVGTLLNNPSMFGVPREDNVNFAKGRLFHQLILEPEKAKHTLETKIVECNSRNTIKYKNFLDDNNLEIALLKKESDNILNLHKTMIGNIDFWNLIYSDKSEFEKPMIKEIGGAMWKGKADVVGEDYVLDIKTTSDINKFKWSARTYNYDSQAYIYQTLFDKPMTFLVIDKNTHVLGMYTPSEDFIERGMNKVREAIEVYKKFFSKTPTHNIESYYINEEL